MRTETPHNTPEQVRQYLADALALVTELDPPEDLRVPLFSAAVDLFAAKHIQLEQVSPRPFAGIVPGR